MIYFLLILIAGVTALAGVPNKTVFLHTQKKFVYNLYGVIYLLIWILIFYTIAFRDSSIGADSFSYLSKYSSIRKTGSYSLYGGFATGEPLYYYLNKGLSMIFGGWGQCIFFFEGAIVAVSFSKVIKEYSIDPFVSTIGFMCFGLFLTSLCLLRQFIAISICLLALKYVFDKNPIRFYGCVLIASMFHMSAIFFGIVYIVCAIMNCTTKNIFFFFCASIAGVLLLDRIQSIISVVFNKWEHYDTVETGAKGYVTFTIFIIITILCTIEKETIISEHKLGAPLLNLNYLNMGVWMMRLVTRTAERVTFYYTIAPILLIPLLFSAIEKKSGKKFGSIFRIVTITLMIVFFIYKFFNDRHYFPYKSFL